MQIYKITNKVNGKIYIGKDTTSDPNYYGSGKLIKRSLEKYGKHNFYKEVLYETDDYKDLSSKEIYFIEFYNSTNLSIGYNISKGGDGGDTLSNNPKRAEIVLKISKADKKAGKTYEEAFGKEKADAYKKKLSDAQKRNGVSQKFIQKSNEYWEAYRRNFREKCDKIKQDIDKGIIDYESLRDIKRKVPDSFLKNAKGFYDFFGHELKYIFGHYKVNREKELDKINKFIIASDYEGLNKYLKNMSLSVFRHRKDFYNYIGKESTDRLNNYRKERLVDVRKRNIKNIKIEKSKRVSVDGLDFESIKQACEFLNIGRRRLTLRLNSPEYPNYKFL